MFKLAILFSIYVFTSAAVFNLPDLSYLDKNDVINQAKFNFRPVQKKGDNLWVLELNDEGLDLKTVRIAHAKEQVVFERVVGPMIEAFKSRPTKAVTEVTSKNIPQRNREELEKKNKNMKTEMMRLINKFAMSIKSDPDAFLSDSASTEATGPSLVLYIKGGYTSLMVSYDRKEWHFFIPPPSPLPAWLYQKRDAGSVDIPDDVRDQLFEKLLHLLQMFLSFPI